MSHKEIISIQVKSTKHIRKVGVMSIRRICFITATLLLAGCTSVDSRWQQAEQDNTVVAYESFVREFPESEYTSLGQKRIAELRFIQAKNVGTEEALQQYLKQHPSGDYSDEARKMADECAYTGAEKENTHWAYEHYLNKYPSGSHRIDAAAKIESLVFRRATETDSVEGYEQFISRYPDSLWALEARTRMAAISKRESFFEDITNAETMNEIRRILGAEDTKQCITSDTIPRIEEILLEKINTNTEKQEAIPAFKATPRGKKGKVTISKLGGIFGHTFKEGRASGSFSEGSITGEVLIKIEDDTTVIVKTEYRGDSIPTVGSLGLRRDGRIVMPKPIIPNAPGSIHRFQGPVKLGGYILWGGFDTLNRLTFVLTEKGYIYLRGAGSVLTPEGNTIMFPCNEVPSKRRPN